MKAKAKKFGPEYQHRISIQGSAVQRFWHFSKELAIERHCPPAHTDHVLDVGCGAGLVSRFLGKSLANVLGVDSPEEAVAFAAEHFSRPNVSFQVCRLDELDGLGEARFEKIYCSEFIEQIPFDATKKIFKSFYDLLKPGGKIFVAVPNYNSLWPLLKWVTDPSKLVPRASDEPQVEYFYSIKLQHVGSQAGFKLGLTSSMCFLAPWLAPLSWELAKRVDAVESRLTFHLGTVLICVFLKA